MRLALFEALFRPLASLTIRRERFGKELNTVRRPPTKYGSIKAEQNIKIAVEAGYNPRFGILSWLAECERHFVDPAVPQNGQVNLFMAFKLNLQPASNRLPRMILPSTIVSVGGYITGFGPLGPECVDDMPSCDYATFVTLVRSRFVLIESKISRTLTSLGTWSQLFAAQLLNSERMYEELSVQTNELRDDFADLHADHQQLNRIQHEELAEYPKRLRVEYNDLATEYEQFRNESEEATLDSD
ncbi:hypothetical protein FRB97_009406 [Tulasnella sp. 331]|nr:hypothetical protein FRB97_009406 [Tulasnella sp. 331]